MVRSCESAVGRTTGAVAAEIFAGTAGALGAFAGAAFPGVAVETCAGWFSRGGLAGGFGPKNLAQSKITAMDKSDATRMRNSGVNLSFDFPSGGNLFIGGVLTIAPRAS